jgi:DNA-binding IscR family transcriptional regulator
MVDLNPKVVYGEVQRIADSKKRPPMSVDEVLTALNKQGLVETVTALRS